MQQVLHNLLSNAIKFTRQGKIQIKGAVNPKADDPDQLLLTVSVSDEGIGLSPEDASRVFDGLIENKDPISRSLNPYSNGIGLRFCK